MLRRLIDRPVAVTMTLVAILIVGVVSIGRLPVSLMPSIDVPRITVEASLPGASAREVDLSVVQPLRRELLQLPSLEDIRCEAGSGSATLVLTFSHGSDAGFNYVETGERIDRAMSYLPAGMEQRVGNLFFLLYHGLCLHFHRVVGWWRVRQLHSHP